MGFTTRLKNRHFILPILQNIKLIFAIYLQGIAPTYFLTLYERVMKQQPKGKNKQKKA
jgi:hypothetical protein